jgi:hypothetical protein
MKKAVAIILVLVSVAVAQAQTPTTESEWRSAREKARRDYRSAQSNMWGGIVLAGAGVALTGIGASHNQVCVVGPGGLARILNPSACDQYAGRADWRLMGPGLGALGGGAAIFLIHLNREGRSAERLTELEDAGKQRGWTVSTRGTSFALAFRW